MVFSGVGMLVTAVALFALNKYLGPTNPTLIGGVIIGFVFLTIIIDKWVFGHISQKIRLIMGIMGWVGTLLLLLLWTMSS